MKNYLIIGNGVAGTTAAEAIRKENKAGNITILTDEGLPFYDRILLNSYIAGDIDEQGLLAKKTGWYEEQDITLRLRTRVVSAEPEERVVITEQGQRLSYDCLLIATGSHSFIPPIKGFDKRGVFALRSVQDARDISAHAGEVEEVVLIGGGLLGLETGNALLRLGKKIKVVEFFPRLLPRQLDVDGARRLQGIMEERGFSFRLGAKTQEITGDNQATAVLLEGGERLSAEAVIISAGVRPNMELAEPLGLEVDKGIKVDEYLRTSRPDVYAAGDVAEFEGIPYGIWTAALEQGKIAGTNMAGGKKIYGGTTMATKLKVVGIDLASAGDIDAENKFESRVVTDEKVYKKIVIEEDQIIGCILLGDTKDFGKITKAMAEKQDVGKTKDGLLAR